MDRNALTEDADRREGAEMKPLSSYVMALLVIGALIVVLLAILQVASTGTEVAAVSQPPWARHLAVVDHAVAEGNVRGAVAAWHEAYAAVLGARRWEGYADVADAWLRVGGTFNAAVPSRVRARELYLTAFLRARQAGSLDGVLRAAKAFGDLGDTGVMQQALRVADGLARDEAARIRVGHLRARLSSRWLAAEEISTF
jgi:hypothetical protein